ncbi:hypothetical protein [Rhodoligotrophos defluvii]|uniref:hypothetical protein n=1 Tax=Rhodoligotrophos defluvii TaxID=2561934 RepID=UPI0010CA0B8B|nr:hypothetical protein [Rhodoligotrophos defluvii]
MPEMMELPLVERAVLGPEGGFIAGTKSNFTTYVDPVLGRSTSGEVLTGGGAFGFGNPASSSGTWATLKEHLTPAKLLLGIGGTLGAGTLFALPQLALMIPQMRDQKAMYERQLKDADDRAVKAKEDQQALIEHKAVIDKILYHQQKHDLELRDQQQAAERVKEFERGILLSKGEKYLKEYQEKYPDLFKADAGSQQDGLHGHGDHGSAGDHAHSAYHDAVWTGA